MMRAAFALIFASLCAVSISSKADTKSEKKEPAAEPKAEEFKRPFAGTAIYWNNQFTAISLDKSREYTYNPAFTMQFGAKPIWAVSKSFLLLTDIGFQTELTNSDYAKKRGEIFFNDIPFEGRYKYLLKLNEDVDFTTGLNASLSIPSSKLSRYATLITALGVGTGATFGFPKVLHGMSLGWSPGFTKYLHKSENPLREGNPLDESSVPETEKQTSVHYLSLNYGGNENPTWTISNSVKLGLRFAETLSFLFSYTHQYVYHYAPYKSEESNSDICVDPQGCSGPRDTGFDERGTYMQIFVYNLDYGLPSPLDLLTLSLGAVTASNQLAEDGTYRTPFFNRHTVVVIGLSLDVDGTVAAVSKGQKK